MNYRELRFALIKEMSQNHGHKEVAKFLCRRNSLERIAKALKNVAITKVNILEACVKMNADHSKSQSDYDTTTFSVSRADLIKRIEAKS